MALLDLVVIGAGPAGAAAAALAAQRGRSVRLLEKERFPRRKVCGEFLPGDAAPALGRLGVRSAVEAEAARVVEGAIHPGRGRPIGFLLAPPAWGISRFTLDALLARRAGELGADVRFGARVLAWSREPFGFRIRYAEAGTEREAECRALVGAWGRWDALDRAPARSRAAQGRRFLGWSRTFAPSPEHAGRVSLFLFPGGYCGLCPVEGGAIRFAGIVSESLRRELPSGWDAAVGHARSASPALDRALAGLTPIADEHGGGFRGAGPVVTRRKPCAERGALIVGDAAGVIDPFSGQGIATALSSGVLAADVLEEALAGRLALDAAARAYARAWSSRFGGRFQWGAAFRRLALHSRVASVAAGLAGPALVRLALRHLSPAPGPRSA